MFREIRTRLWVAREDFLVGCFFYEPGGVVDDNITAGVEKKNLKMFFKFHIT